MTDQKQPETPAGSSDVPAEVEGLHPVAFFLAEELRPGTDGQEFAPFPEEVGVEMAQFLHSLTEKEDGGEELIHCVHTIAAFIHANRTESPAMTAQVRELLDLPFVLDGLKKWSVSTDPEQVNRIAQKFGNFAGLDTQKKAPKIGDEKPEGAVDLNALNFPKRL
jgi:hypothetical protein